MFFVRPRRILRETDTEVWSMEYNFGDGFVSDDALVIHFVEDRVYAWLIIKDECRQSIEEYSAYAYAVIGGTDENDENIFLNTIVNHQVDDCYPEELIKMIKSL